MASSELDQSRSDSVSGRSARKSGVATALHQRRPDWFDVRFGGGQCQFDVPGQPQVVDGTSGRHRSVRDQRVARLTSLCDGQPRGDRAASYLLHAIEQEAYRLGVPIPFSSTTPYINTIPVEKQPVFPATVSLSDASRASSAGMRWRWWCGPIAKTRASAATSRHLLRPPPWYEVAMNHFIRGRGDDYSGDQVYFQGHASPGIYSRAFVEGRSRATAGELPAGTGRWWRAFELSTPLADAQLLGVPNRLDGPRADHGHLPGSLQQVSPRSWDQGHQ
jgi:hypothetical protein